MPAAARKDSGADDFEFGGRRLFVLAALAALLVVSMFHWDARGRIRGPLIADSVEYLTMARYASEGLSLTVKPVRAGLFPLLLAIPLQLQRLGTGDPDLVPAGGIEDPSIALSVLFLFNALAILGTYRLGRLLRGPWTGLLAAYFVGLLPEFTYWSFDFLTDVPAAALVLWAIVFHVERKPFRAGLTVGLAVVMRYQCLIPLGAIFLVPLVLRRWKVLGWMLLGLVPAAGVLAAVDAYYWGEPFHTLMLYVPRQLTTFLPADVVAKFLPLEQAQGLPVSETNQALEDYASKGNFWYVEHSPWIFTRVLIYAFLLYPLARRSMRSRAGADFTLWVTFVSLLVLSAQRYKEPRYLVSVAPMIAALGAAGALWVIAGVVRILGRNGIGAIGTGLVLLGLVGVTYGRSCRVIQRRLWFQPFGSYLQAAETIPEEARPATVGLERRWLLSLEHPVRATGGWAWFSRDFAAFDLANAVSFFQARPSQWDELPARRVVDELDYVLIPPPQTPAEMGRQRWLNDRTLFDGYFFDRHENETACIRLRRCDDSGGNGPFWNTDDRRAREGAAMAEFTAGVKLVGFDATVLPTAPDGVKFDVRWRLPDTEGLRVIAIVSVMNEWRGMLARYQSWLLPGDETGQRERRGAALRDTHYTSLLARPAGGDLHVEVRVVVIEEGQSPMVQRLSVPGREEVLEGPAAVFPLVVPQRTAPATPPANAAEPPLPPPRG